MHKTIELDLDYIKEQSPSKEMLKAVNYFVNESTIDTIKLKDADNTEKVLELMADNSNELTARVKRFEHLKDKDLLDLEEYVKEREKQEMTKLTELEQSVEGLLGAIMAHKIRPTVQSSKVIRDLTKVVESIGVPVRKELIALDKTLINND